MKYKVVMTDEFGNEDLIARFKLQDDAEHFVEFAQKQFLFAYSSNKHIKIEGPGDYFRREEVARG